jgi:hypothetical protein
MSSNGESLDIYAIDNSIDDVLMGKNGRNLEYNTFLRELLQNDKMTDMLTNAIIASMEKAISSRIESICEKLKSSEAQAESLKLKTQFEPFLKALSSEETKNEMRKGLQEMSNNLNRLQSSWNDGTLDSLKEYLKSTYPELLDILSGRFETLKSARSQL